MFRVPHTRNTIHEDAYKVVKFKRLLEPEGNRTERILQFYAGEPHGGLRTVAINDIVSVTASRPQ